MEALKKELAEIEARIEIAVGAEKSLLIAQFAERIARLKERIGDPTK